jgi:hypothetical protein
MSIQEKSWHRQADESDRAFRAFSLYLGQPSPRSLLYVRNAGYSPVSVYKWKKNHNWIQRAIDYDNHRADSIMEQDVSLVNLYQRKVTEAGLEDMQILRQMWMNAAQKIQEETTDNPDLTPAQLMANINGLAKARLSIDKLARLSARMPDAHRAMIVPEDAEAFPNTVIELSFNGARSIPDEVEETFDDTDDSEEEEIIT